MENPGLIRIHGQRYPQSRSVIDFGLIGLVVQFRQSLNDAKKFECLPPPQVRRTAEKTLGVLPENVNFGIKASTLRQFLTANSLPTKWSERKERMSSKDIAKIAKNQAVMVVCGP